MKCGNIEALVLIAMHLKGGCRTKQLVRSLFSMKKIQPGFEKSGCWCKI